MKLLVFPHSHYCEKARWALDYKGVPFENVAILPGFHVVTVRKFAPKTSVPVLLAGDEVVQGSSEIIDYLDKRFPSRSLTPIDVSESAECWEIESSMDEKLGENIRRVLYHSLLDHSDFIRHCFTHSMAWPKKIIFSMFYPVLRRKIYTTYVISSSRVDQAKGDFEQAMNELEARLKGRQYLVADRFSRADLSVAAMLSLLVLPEEHPLPWGEIPHSEAREFCERYQHHPVADWVRQIYRNHRTRVDTRVDSGKKPVSR